MIEDLDAFVEASFAAIVASQVTDSFSRLAQSFGYTATLIVDTGKLSSAFATAILHSTLPRRMFTSLEEQVPFLTHPLVRLASSLDAPFDLRDVCAQSGIPEGELRFGLPESLQHAEIVVLPVHRGGTLKLFVGCGGAAPDRTIAGRMLLHACAHVVYDRCAVVHEDAWMPRRQADCLFWAAQGKTYAEMGRILRVSPRTVRADLAKAKRQLDAGTKGEAIAKAITRNGK